MTNDPLAKFKQNKEQL